MKKLIMLMTAIIISSMLWCPPWQNPHDLAFWDFQDNLQPVDDFDYAEYVITNDISISEGEIQFMDGIDGGNTRIGYADRAWTTDTNYSRQDPPDKYIEYSLRARWNYAVHFDSFTFRFGRNEVGPQAVVVEMFLNDQPLLENPILLEPEITSEDPNNLDEYVIPISEGLRYSGPDDYITVRLYPLGAIEVDDIQPRLLMNNFRVNGFIGTIPAIALLMDRSGSMGDQTYGSLNYWPATVHVANTFVENVMLYLDTVSVISFDVPDIFGDPEDFAVVEWEMVDEEGRLSQLWHAPTQPDTVVTRQQVINAIDAIDDPGDGRTSIGAPILAAISELNDAADSRPGKKSMIMLTDGLDNWAPFARDVIQNDLPEDMSIYTIALGPISDGNLLQWIAAQTGGLFYFQPNAEDLAEVYFHLYSMGIIDYYDNFRSRGNNIDPDERQSHDVIVDDKTQHIKFLLFAGERDEDREATPLEFTLISPSGQVIDRDAAGEMTSITYAEGSASKSYELWFPETGTWQLRIDAPGINESMRYFTAAYGSSGIRMSFEYGEEEYRINDPVSLRVRLYDRQDGISGSNVRAEITPPSEDVRNLHYSEIDGTPFADYEPERTVSRRIETTRNPGETIVVNLNEVRPGIYEGTFNETGVSGVYNLRIFADADNEEYRFNRQDMSSIYIAPPEPLGIPHLAQPSDEAEDVQAEGATFVWSDVLDAENYHFQLADTREILYDIRDIEENHLVLDNLDYDARYSWRVKATAGEREGFWSQIFYFRTGIPELPGPQSLEGHITGKGVNLQWTAPAAQDNIDKEPVSYEVYRNDCKIAAVDCSQTGYLDDETVCGMRYTYYVKAMYGESEDWKSQPSNIVEIFFTGIEKEGVPLITEIKGSYPNPFNPETTVTFALSKPEMTKVAVYNIIGQKVRTLVNEPLEAGNYAIVWDSQDEGGRTVGSGVYFIKMQAGDYRGHQKVLFLK